MSMKSSSQIVHGGGWLTRHTVGGPRARFFGFLSVLWPVVSIIASFPFWNGWPESFGYLGVGVRRAPRAAAGVPLPRPCFLADGAAAHDYGAPAESRLRHSEAVLKSMITPFEKADPANRSGRSRFGCMFERLPSLVIRTPAAHLER